PKAYEYSWNDEVLALNQFAGVLQSATSAVASALDTTTTGKAVVVYNPLEIARHDVVEARLSFGESSPKGVHVFGSDGKEVPSQIVSTKDGATKVLFLASAPAVGFTVYDVRPSTTESASTSSLT